MRFIFKGTLRSRQLQVRIWVAGAAAFVVAVGCLAQGVFSYRAQMKRTLRDQGEFIATLCSGALASKSPQEQQHVLDALRSDSRFRRAAVYDSNGATVVSYFGAGVTNPQSPVFDEKQDRLDPKRVSITVPIRRVDNGQILGSIYLESNLSELYERLGLQVLFSGALWLLGLGSGLFLASRLERYSVRPMLRVVEAARSIGASRDYSLRISRETDDELGEVVDGYNELLQQIYSRDAELEQARQLLEMGVQDSMAGLQKEILERRCSEEALLDSQRFLQSTLDALSAHIAILDQNGKITFVNAAWSRFARLNGYTGKENGLGENYLKACQCTEVPEASAAAVGIASVMDGSLERYEQDYPCHSPVERWWFMLRVTKFPHKGVLRVVVAHENITERRTAEEALRLSEERFALALKGTNEGLWDWNFLNGQIYFAPRWKQMLGYLEHELPNATSTWTNLLHPDDRDQTERHVQAFLSRELDAYEVEFRMRHKEGHYVPILSRAFGSFDATGKALRLVGTHIDLTYRKKVERERQIGAMQLQQAHRLEAIGQLAAGIAHEINTPTQYIGDNTRFLQDSFADLKKVLDAYGELVQAASSHPEWLQPLQKIEEAARSADLDYLAVEIPKAIQQSLDGVERVSHIVRAMKDFSHPGSSEKTLVDLHKAIESTITVCRNEWKYVAEIATTFDLGLPPVPALPGALNQVILNLVVNAAHAIADVVGNGGTDRGMIHISTKQDGNWVEIRISDTGTGIPEPARGRIFDPFFTTKPVGKGTGQGLAISHNVVTEKHGGTLSFETELGKGTTFIIRLPLDTPALKAA